MGFGAALLSPVSSQVESHQLHFHENGHAAFFLHEANLFLRLVSFHFVAIHLGKKRRVEQTIMCANLFRTAQGETKPVDYASARQTVKELRERIRRNENLLFGGAKKKGRDSVMMGTCSSSSSSLSPSEVSEPLHGKTQTKRKSLGSQRSSFSGGNTTSASYGHERFSLSSSVAPPVRKEEIGRKTKSSTKVLKTKPRKKMSTSPPSDFVSTRKPKRRMKRRSISSVPSASHSEIVHLRAAVTGLQGEVEKIRSSSSASSALRSPSRASGLDETKKLRTEVEAQRSRLATQSRLMRGIQEELRKKETSVQELKAFAEEQQRRSQGRGNGGGGGMGSGSKRQNDPHVVALERKLGSMAQVGERTIEEIGQLHDEVDKLRTRETRTETSQRTFVQKMKDFEQWMRAWRERDSAHESSLATLDTLSQKVTRFGAKARKVWNLSTSSS
jgi:hypothetical protein